ncbi:MAG: RNA-binding cell elongation regulator Jag/EloR [Tepidanaerobacteraceae bacterium]|nr:protein jag [Thermoanaerobacterales bacterium]
MKVLEKQGKTVDEAINLALEELKVSRDDVEVEILEEGNKGILGFLSKMARVKVTVKPKPDEIATEFLRGLLNFIDKDVKIHSSFKDGVLNVELEGGNVGILIGKRGSTLDALQYLTSLVTNKDSDDYTRVLLDTENYREKREKTLERLALKMASKVKDTRRSVTLEPMYPNERRIIHTTLQDDLEVKTKSVGEEPFRKVVISLK